MPVYTLLSIDGITFPDDAVKGISVTLKPDSVTGSLERDVNGTLVDLTISGFQKYRASISCTDMAAPDLTGIFKGSGPHTVVLIQNLGAPNNSDGTLTLSMMVDDFEVATQEWEATVDWSLELVEV